MEPFHEFSKPRKHVGMTEIEKHGDVSLRNFLLMRVGRRESPFSRNIPVSVCVDRSGRALAAQPH